MTRNLQVADIFTKALPRVKHWFFCRQIGVFRFTNINLRGLLEWQVWSVRVVCASATCEACVCYVGTKGWKYLYIFVQLTRVMWIPLQSKGIGPAVLRGV